MNLWQSFKDSYNTCSVTTSTLIGTAIPTALGLAEDLTDYTFNALTQLNDALWINKINNEYGEMAVDLVMFILAANLVLPPSIRTAKYVKNKICPPKEYEPLASESFFSEKPNTDDVLLNVQDAENYGTMNNDRGCSNVNTDKIFKEKGNQTLKAKKQSCWDNLLDILYCENYRENHAPYKSLTENKPRENFSARLYSFFCCKKDELPEMDISTPYNADTMSNSGKLDLNPIQPNKNPN